MPAIFQTWPVESVPRVVVVELSSINAIDTTQRRTKMRSKSLLAHSLTVVYSNKRKQRTRTS
jgi:hypothetical protein